jgi:predicted amidohydrolase
MAVESGQPERNLALLLGLAREAAQGGARLIVAPEMSLSGYCFEDRASVLPFAQSADGPALAAVRDLARELKVYVALGLAELAEETGILYNSAFLVDDQGAILGRSRKINAESRWASPGDQKQDNVFPTPWGRVALHVCSDSWNSLIARVSAVKGADLLLLLANWPPAGLNPLDLWRFRALENGLWFVACNRTGAEAGLDCTEAASCAYDPWGREIFSGQSPGSAVFRVELPLGPGGKLDSSRRKEIMGQRDVARCHRLYGNFTGLKFLTGFLKLPEPGLMTVAALIPPPGQSPAGFLGEAPLAPSPDLLLLPAWPYSGPELALLKRLTEGQPALTRLPSGEWVFLGGLAGERAARGSDGLCLIDLPKARAWLAEPGEIAHPEPTLAAAKWGTDLAIAYVGSLTPKARLLAALRPIDQLACAVVAPDGAAMGLPWQGHDPGRGAWAGPGEAAALEIDVAETREKRFQDRLDFEALFRPSLA